MPGAAFKQRAEAAKGICQDFARTPFNVVKRNLVSVLCEVTLILTRHAGIGQW